MPSPAMNGSCLVSQLLQLCGQDRDRTAFDSLHPPVLSAYQYMDRLERYLKPSSLQLELAWIYLVRFRRATGKPFSFSSVHRLLGVAIVLAQKFDEDVPYSTVAYARIVGVVPKELNKLQRLFLQEIDYCLTYPPWFNLPSA